MKAGSVIPLTALAIFAGCLVLLSGCGVAPDLRSFPWPPPQASTWGVIPDTMLVSGEATTLGDVDRKLKEALWRNGYFESSYFMVPQGFALVTRMESIENDGSPKPELARWETGGKIDQPRTLSEYLKALFRGKPGFYRLIVFIVTPVDFAQSDEKVSEAEAEAWLREGYNRLPPSLEGLDFTGGGYACSALVYEFACEVEGGQAKLLTPSRLTWMAHLEKAKIWEALE